MINLILVPFFIVFIWFVVAVELNLNHYIIMMKKLNKPVQCDQETWEKFTTFGFFRPFFYTFTFRNPEKPIQKTLGNIFETSHSC